MDRLIMFLTNNQSIQEVLFFPQMKPEKKAVELTDEEKSVFKLLKDKNVHELNTIKDTSGLSNKKWDKAVKGLRKHKMIDVFKEGEVLQIKAS